MIVLVHLFHLTPFTFSLITSIFLGDHTFAVVLILPIFLTPHSCPFVFLFIVACIVSLLFSPTFIVLIALTAVRICARPFPPFIREQTKNRYF
ncbi:hypothetical protein BKA57DRAFT_449256 [Linnemannia elongata]|nr:hypothetical protein BKA57DRAFT_449256 [Linnemannia elongata]